MIEIVKSEDPGRYRVPISLGEPVADLDKRLFQYFYFHKTQNKIFFLDGQACIIFTIIIHPDFYRRAHSSQTFMNFLLTLIYEGLENKYPQFKLDTGKIDIISLIIFFILDNIHTIKSINRKKKMHNRYRK